ncbi:heavy metal translocating P-type ATPase [Parahaliea maris]|uniref:Heavy metal translocating P-type ATPase n=1 Tax=Parahaliea maris TaxID=2716870 RepID=A0A5C9A7D5_9GAMM|nr:heavy metal translocating P-type ATPase [Parahaliea maris]TXS95487.1 heavy metal translocating P-type ATPase [Parahaliea maris]
MTARVEAIAQTPSSPAPREQTRCFHCGEDVPAGSDFKVEIEGALRPMCCPGCEAVATLVRDGGLAAYYRRRTDYGERPDTTPGAAAFQIYDQPEVAAGFSTAESDGICHARLLLGGVSCAACTWLIEQGLSQLEGVVEVNVNLQHQRLDIRFHSDQLPLSRVFERIERLGYHAQPFLAQAQREQLDADHRRSLRRLAVAGLGMMQAGMFAIALHAGDLQGIDSEYRDLMRWVSLIITGFVVLYSARTFFENAWRHLRAGALVMDLPVALAIGLAWLASAWATLSGSGQVYFDSVVMFTFFLLLGRFLEQRMRRRFQLNWYEVESALPAVVQRREDDSWTPIPRVAVIRGDHLLVPAGSTLAVDGTVIKGKGSVREDTFNGEHQPRVIGPGDTVFAGTLNLEGALEIAAAGPFSESRLAALQQSVGRASGAKPLLWRLADRVAGAFVLAVLLLTSATALVWYSIDPARALWVSLSVLVISCPCALALATPAALTSAAAALRRKGVLVHGENALDALARADTLVVDKTGTLTTGRFAIETIVPLSGEQPQTGQDTALCAVAAALQRASRHPVARVFDQQAAAPGFHDALYEVGAGVSARDAEQREWRMGSAAFCRAIAPELPAAPDQQHYWVALVRADAPQAWFAFDDRLRPEAAAQLQQLQQAGLHTEMLSGDSADRVATAARSLPLDRATGGLSPEQKLARLDELQKEGRVVVAVGDGLNDGPLLAQADASFAVADATDLARAQADFVIEGRDLDAVGLTWRTALRCRRIILQNMAWALGYNGCAIPLAACGLVPPWAAALGMSASSLLVVLNSLRLTRNGN